MSGRPKSRFEGAAPCRPSRPRHGGPVPRGRDGRAETIYSQNALAICILEDGREAVQAIPLAILLANWSSIDRSLPLDLKNGWLIFDAGYHKRALFGC